MMDLADYLQAEVDKAQSIRKVAKHIGISKTAVDNITKRKLKSPPELLTLEKIALAYGMTTATVVEMAGMMMGNRDKYVRAAQALEQSPWIAKRFDELLSLDEKEFNYWMDWVKWRRNQNGAAPGSTPDPPTQ